MPRWTVFWKKGRLEAVDEFFEEYPRKDRRAIVGYARSFKKEDAIRYFENLEKRK